MLDIVIRPLALADLPSLVEIDPSYHTDYVWQMDLNQATREVGVSFREVRLPRSMRVDYPREAAQLAEDWKERDGILAAELDEEPVGYISLSEEVAPKMISATDLIVLRRLRRQGIGMALVRAAQTWASQRDADRLVLEMQSKNYPAICMASKLGFEFCGYNDQYYANQDIALFFAKRI